MADQKFTKPTPDELWNTEFFQEHAHAAIEKVCEEYRNLLISQFARIVDKCESPLEAAFAAWWRSLSYPGGMAFNLLQQVDVEACGHRYRLDLVVEPESYDFYSKTDKDIRPRIAIELDGHDFHEKTKEQVTYRNRRDRDLMSAGWQIWHVSGSEFHRAPYETVFGEYMRAIRAYAKVFPIVTAKD